MKHLKKFNESIEDTKRDIIENFSYINDLLGEPTIKNEKWDDKYKWTISWDIGIDITSMNNVSIVIEKLKKITDEIDDILSAKDRLSNYYFQMSISDKLEIEIIPNIKTSDDYKFILKQDNREIILNSTDIEKFFFSRGIKLIKKWIKKDIDYGVCSSYFRFDKYDINIFNEFNVKFDNEHKSKIKSGEMDREIDVRFRLCTIEIFPCYEKTYISF